MRARRPDDEPRRKQIGGLISTEYDMLTRYESVDGGWGYYDFRTGSQRPGSSSTSFVNATMLVAFHEAKQAGYPPPEKLVERAVASLERQKKPDDSYLYGEYLPLKPMHPVKRHGGNLGRSQA